jgi:hypothetical protein
VTEQPHPGPGLRERAALSLLRTATDLARRRQAAVDRMVGAPPGRGRDAAIGHLAMSAYAEKLLLWLGWRLLPGTAVTEGLSRPAR